MSTKLRTHGKGVVVWLLLGVMVLGLGGFGVGSFTGGTQAVGSVGDTEITLNDYARAMRQQINDMQRELGRPVSMADARAAGVDRQVQGQLFQNAAFAEEARRLGLSVGDSEVARQITSVPAFQGATGGFDREVYRMTLRQQGFNEGDFESQLRSDVSRSLLQGAVAGGIGASPALINAFAGYVTETRPIAWAEVTDFDLSEKPGTADEAALKAYYEAHLASYTRPSTRDLSYVWLTPDMLKDAAEPDEASLRAAYEQRLDEYVQPERRMVDKLVFPNAQEAQAAKARLDAGSVSFEALARERGLEITDIDLGEVTRADLGSAGDAVFALSGPGVAGPVETALGPALFKMNGILPAEETSFEQARPDLATEATLDRARRMIGDMTAGLEDHLASGATLEDMAKETKMQLGKISMTPETRDGIAAYQGFRDAADAATEQDFPELRNLDDGGVFALRLDGVTPAAPRPFEEVRDQVAQDWQLAEQTRLKSARAAEVAAAVDAGAALADQGLLVSNVAGVERASYIEGAPATLIEAAFTTEPGKSKVVTDAGRVFVVVPGAPRAADPADPELVQLRKLIAGRITQSLSADVQGLFAGAVQAERGLSVNSTAINAVQAQMQ